MWRMLFEELVEWKDDPKRMVLLLEGVRQCGKTYLLKELGKNCFSDTVYVNFEKDEDVHSLFDRNLDAHRIIDDLGIYFNKDKKMEFVASKEWKNLHLIILKLAIVRHLLLLQTEWLLLET